MTDIELLELAAKVAGIETHGAMRADWLNGHSTYWNPLADDGDALRLAVKLAIDIWRPGDACVHAVGSFGEETVEELRLDNLAATRRAIVRAAAEIGKDKT